MRRNILLAILGLMLILIIAIPAYWYQSVTASAELENTVASQLSNQLGRHVDIGSVRIQPTGTVVVQDVIIDDAGKVLAVAKEVHVKYNPLYIFTDNPFAGLRSIDFRQPEIFLTRSEKSGEWNIVRFLKDVKKSEQGLILHTAIHITDGKITITDVAKADTIEQVHGQLQYNGTTNVSVRAEGRFHSEPIEVLGFINTKTGGYGMQIDSRGQQLKELNPWFQQNDIALKDGVVNLSIFLLQEQYQPLAYSGEVEVVNGALELHNLGHTVSKINGKINAASDTFFLNKMAMELNGEPVSATGSISIGGVAPYLDIAVSSSGMEVAKALPEQHIPVIGSMKFALHVTGQVKELRATGTVQMDEGSVNNIPVGNVKTQIVYQNNWVDVKELTGRVWGGNVNGQAVIKLGTLPVYNAFIHLDGVNPPNSIGSGNITGGFYITGTGEHAVSSVWGVGQVTNGAVKNIAFESADLGFYWGNDELRLDYLQMQVGGGTLLATGSGNNNGLSIDIRGTNLPVDRLNAMTANIAISGVGQVKGKLNGTFQAPVFTADFEIVNGRLLEQKFETSTGKLVLANQNLTLLDVQAKEKNTKYTIDGQIQLQPDIAINLRIASANAVLSDLLKIMKIQEPISGVVDNEVLVSGPINNLAVDGRAVLKRVEYNGQRFDRIQANYGYQDGNLAIKDGKVIMGRANLDFYGTMNGQQELDFAFQAQNIYLEELKQTALPAGLAGKAEFYGHVTGTAKNPIVAGNIFASDAVINGQKFGTFTGNVHYADGQLNIPEMKLTEGNACYQFLGNINFNMPATIEGALTAREGQLTQLLGLLGYPITDAQGTVTADLVLSGLLERPDAKGTLLVKNGNVRGYPVDRLEIDAVSHGGVITVNKLELLQGQGFLRAQGVWMLDGALAMEVGGKNLDAGFISALLPNPQPVRGTINFTAQVGGTTDAPQAATSVEIKNGSWDNVDFDALYALVLLDKDVLKVNQVMLSKGSYRASAYGTIPLAALTKKGREEPDSPTAMDLRIRLDQADLSILPLLSKDVAWAVGQTQGEVRLGGNLYQPYLFGSFSVKDGTIKLRSVTTPIEHANLNLQFEADQIRLETFNGNVGGGRYDGSGHATLKGFSLQNLNFSLKLDTLYVNSKYYVGPIQGELALESTTRTPLLKGSIVLENAVIMPPVLWPEMSGATPALRLDLELQANKSVRLQNPSLYDMYIQGKVKAQGTLREPITSGRLTVTRGTLQYLNTPFKITEGTADFIQYGSFLPTVRVAAETKLLQTKVRLSATGPLSQMEIKLSSDPSMPQQQLLTLLTLRSRGGDKNGGTSGGNQPEPGTGNAVQSQEKDELLMLLNQGLQFTFVQRVEEVVGNFLGVDEFNITREQNKGVTDKEIYSIEVGKSVSEKLFIGYTTSLAHAENRTYRFRYDITNHLALEGEMDNEKNKRLGIEARFAF